MRFQFFPLRFEFRAVDPLYFPPGKAGNVLRGAMGAVFKRTACAPECLETRTCPARAGCAYAQVFEPGAHGGGPSGLTDWPRPFVFRARHLDGCAIAPGQLFHFDLHVFSLDPNVLSSFVRTFAALAREGFGPRRGTAELECVRRLALGDIPEQVVYESGIQTMAGSVEPVSLDLKRLTSSPQKIRVDFLSPTELKHEHRIAGSPEFPILFGRVRDRISTLRALYGPGALAIDFQSMGARAADVRMTRCEVRRREFERRSTRTGQTHSIGGFVGFAEYEGELAEFLPYLEVARWVGVGRQAVWGKGEISLLSPQ